MREEFPALLSLARDRSDYARIQLAEKLSDLFLSGDVALTENEENMVNELIDMLLKTEDVNVRHALVKKFAEMKCAPRKIALSLAYEPIDVAQPVIASSQTLTDEDLIMIVETQSDDHACAVAMREKICEAVADALVTTGSLKVMQLVAENLGAKLSPKAIGLLSETARLVQSLQQPIMHRPELTSELASKLYWWVSQDLRRQAIERFGFKEGLLDLSLSKAIDIKLSEHTFERHEDTAMDNVATWLEERGAISLSILPKLLRLGHFRLFNIALSRLSKLNLSSVDAITNEHGGRLLAALCRAIGIDKASFVSIFLLSRAARVDEHVVHPRELSQALAAFDKMNMESAQNMLTTWRNDPSMLDKYSQAG